MKLKTSQSYLFCKEKYGKVDESRNGKNATTTKKFRMVQLMCKFLNSG